MRKYKISYWNSNNLGEPEQVLYIKEEDCDEVLKFCKMKGLKSYCIFDDLGLNIYTFGNGIGQYNPISKWSRKNALEKRGKEKNGI